MTVGGDGGDVVVADGGVGAQVHEELVNSSVVDVNLVKIKSKQKHLLVNKRVHDLNEVLECRASM